LAVGPSERHQRARTRCKAEFTGDGTVAERAFSGVAEGERERASAGVREPAPGTPLDPGVRAAVVEARLEHPAQRHVPGEPLDLPHELPQGREAAVAPS